MIAREDIEALIRGEGNVLGPEGEEIGGIGHVYLDDDTGEPCWVTVKTGLFGIRESFVPLEGAWIQGKDLIVQYGKDQVRDAPLVNPDEDPEPDEEARLYHHYRPGRKRTYSDVVGARSRADTDELPGNGYEHQEVPGATAQDVPGPPNDDAKALPGIQPQAGTERQNNTRTRLRKYVVTENVTGTPPDSHDDPEPGRAPVIDDTQGQDLRQENIDAAGDDEHRH
ncbi:photosystem reaction center subunit H [Pseudarthrobacter psychrotolerans]|uniref:Photosystem reaction center subunit H n=1 Tax=Pseudarthrobacter psychrotolerans TaxID=2697569 RepID=A0A6P1NHE9_9MICC|nr:PRC-barrel domain-containing protein [Pseudarthrobacter psychrotolerans]QHK19756.1 photosystem reaction center subunit H [Pseudarthrobacter psychrotolerans]